MDARKKKTLLVLAVGSLILAWRGYAVATKYLPSSAEASTATDALAEPDPGSLPTPGQFAAAHAANPPDVDLEATWDAQRTVAEQPWGRDPFGAVPWATRAPKPQDAKAAEPIDEPPPEPPSIAFTGVSKSGGQWLAVVQGRIVRVGDEIDDGFRVVSIAKNDIILESNGWRFRCKLGGEEARLLRKSEHP